MHFFLKLVYIFNWFNNRSKGIFYILTYISNIYENVSESQIIFYCTYFYHSMHKKLYLLDKNNIKMALYIFKMQKLDALGIEFIYFYSLISWENYEFKP